MICHDPGHLYELRALDCGAAQTLRFAKRIGANYPGNSSPAYGGTNCQEPLRAIVDRVDYLNGQFWCVETTIAGLLLRLTIWLFEIRANRIKRRWPPSLRRAVNGPICAKCGHVSCPRAGSCIAEGGEAKRQEEK